MIFAIPKFIVGLNLLIKTCVNYVLKLFTYFEYICFVKWIPANGPKR